MLLCNNIFTIFLAKNQQAFCFNLSCLIKSTFFANIFFIIIFVWCMQKTISKLLLNSIIIIGCNPALQQHIFLVPDSFFANINQLCEFFICWDHKPASLCVCCQNSTEIWFFNHIKWFKCHCIKLLYLSQHCGLEKLKINITFKKHWF